MTANITLNVALVVGAWLIVCSVCDWRKREVPSFLTIIPLVLAVLWSAIYGNAPAALLTVLLFLITTYERKPAIVLTILSLVFTLVLGYFIMPLSIVNIFPLFIILGISLSCELGKIGGADAHVFLIITLVFGITALMYALIAGGVYGVFALATKKTTIPYIVPITAGVITFFVVSLI
jgi:hypothetical protein